MIPIQNFDFLIGKWTVINKRLKDRLNNCSDWIEFPATMETIEILNGLGSTDEMRTNYFGEEFIGLSLRLVNPKTKEWTIYWADTMHMEQKLKEQVVGYFKNGIGLFYGQERFNGNQVKLRFRWEKESLDTARWEQAYYDEKNEKWETNWIMEFTKV